MPAFSVKKPLTIFVATLAVIVLGVVAYLKMTPDLMPNMDFPYVIVVTTDPGASPESIEEEITKPILRSPNHIVLSISNHHTLLIFTRFHQICSKYDKLTALVLETSLCPSQVLRSCPMDAP